MRTTLEIPEWEVWHATDDHGVGIGCLITVQNAIDRPVAWIPQDEKHPAGACQELGKYLTQSPGELDSPPHGVIDLREYGWLDSPRPMPAVLYGLRYYREPFSDPVRACPFCRFRFAEMVRQAIPLYFDAKELESNRGAVRLSIEASDESGAWINAEIDLHPGLSKHRIAKGDLYADGIPADVA